MTVGATEACGFACECLAEGRQVGVWGWEGLGRRVEAEVGGESMGEFLGVRRKGGHACGKPGARFGGEGACDCLLHPGGKKFGADACEIGDALVENGWGVWIFRREEIGDFGGVRLPGGSLIVVGMAGGAVELGELAGGKIGGCVLGERMRGGFDEGGDGAALVGGEIEMRGG